MLPKLWFPVIEMSLLFLDFYAYIYATGYVTPTIGVYWFVSLCVAALKTIYTGHYAYKVVNLDKGNKLREKTDHALIIGIFHNTIMLLIEYHYIQKVYDHTTLLQDTESGELPIFSQRRDIISCILFIYIFLRLVVSYCAGWDMGVISPTEYILYLWASLSMALTSIIKKFGSEHFFKIENYLDCINVNKDQGRILIDLYDDSCLSVCDIALYTSILSFLAALLLIYIYKAYLIFKPRPVNTQSDTSNYDDTEEELNPLKSFEK